MNSELLNGEKIGNKGEKSFKNRENVVPLQNIINKKVAIDYERLRDVSERVIGGKAAITRLNSKEEQGRISGGRRNVEASIHLGANAETERGDGTTVSERGRSKTQENIIVCLK